MTGRNWVSDDWHTCPGAQCRNKRAYHTRRGAKTALRDHIDRRADRDDYRTALGIYRCPHDERFWHLGHKPRSVVTGHVARSDYRKAQ